MPIQIPRLRWGLLLLLLALPRLAAAQAFQTVGTRAQGMGGAFVGVADDATAVYWNPGGLAAGAYFSLVLDGNTGKAVPAGRSAGRGGGWLLALTLPAVGLSYYRLEDTVVRPAGDQAGEFRVNTLVTHHAGITLVQSLADGVAVGATIKLVRGTAAVVAAPAAQAEDLLDGWDALGRTGSRADLDVGIMATGRLGSIGLTVRNLTEPSFETGDDEERALERQARAGVSILLVPSWKLAADVDLTTNDGLLGDLREVALGTEGRLTRRLTARAGLRLNTAGDRGRSPAVSAGGSVVLTGGVFLDAQITGGTDDALRGWGVAGRLVF